MEMNDNTILRIKVPAHLYETVKAQLTLKEAKQNFGTKDMKPVKGQKAAGAASDKPKATKPAAPKKDMAPKEEAKVPKDGHKKMGLEELKALAELLNNEITKLEEKSHDKEEKAPVEEEKEKVEEKKEEGYEKE
jgi:hypothetical protein